jgi:fatty acid desaturase
MDRARSRQVAELRRRLSAVGFFGSSDGFYLRKLALLFVLFALTFAGALRLAGALRVACDLVLGLWVVQLGIIGHDAGHRAVNQRAWLNDLIGHISLTVTSGLAFAYFRHRHDLHHRYSQDPALDPDMQFDVVYSVHAEGAAQKRGLARRMLRFQALYFWPVATLYSYSLRWDSAVFAVKRRDLMAVDRWLLVVHYLLWLVLPSLWVGPRVAAFNYVVSSAVIAVLLTALFSINHIGLPTTVSGGGWVAQQAGTSRNIGNPPRFDWFFGGLNFQIEHHLFPRVGQDRLRRGQSVVRAFCAEHGIAYHEERFFEAQRSVLRHLARVAKTAEAVSDRRWRRGGLTDGTTTG